MADYSDGTAYGTMVSAALILVERQTLTAAATTITFSNLNGDQDLGYEWRITGTNGAGAATYLTMKPNNLATNQHYNGTYQRNINAVASATNLAAATGGTIGADEVAAGGGPINSFGRFFARTGQHRFWSAEGVTKVDATEDASYLTRTIWSDTSTNVTSIVFNSSAASGFASGTVAELWKVK